MKTGIYSIAAGWMQTILVFSGNTLMNLGWRILLIMPLLIILTVIIIKGLKSRKQHSSIALKAIFVLSISSLVYATIMSLIAGHIIPFQQSYAIFSTPYFIMLLGASIFWLFHSSNKSNRYGMNVLIFLQLAIMTFSFITIYFGFDSHTKVGNNYEVLSAKISELTTSENLDLTIVYKEAKTAIEINKYLDKNLGSVKQVIDSTGTNPQLYLQFTNGRKQTLMLE